MKLLTNKRGFSLLETGLTLVVGGLIVGALWLVAATIQENGRKVKFTEQTMQIISNTRRVFGNAGVAPNVTGASATTAAAIRAGIFPSEMIVAGSANPIGVYRSDVLLSHNTGTTPPTFRLSMDQVNPDGCVALMSKMVRDAAMRRQYGIVAAYSTQNIDQQGRGNLGNEDIPANRMTQICGGGATGSKRGPQPIAVHIEFRYY